MEDALVALGVLVLAGLAFLALGLPLWCLVLLYQLRRRQDEPAPPEAQPKE